jgi:serine phosphatase RsbU (regulator of sigma subunit)
MKHILLVDDSVVNLKLAKAALEQEYKVTMVTSGEEALKFLEKKQPDLILLDIEMPGLSGFDVVEKMKETGRLSRAPVIFLTAIFDPDVEARALSQGVVDFIHKPFATEAMLSRVRLHLEINDYRKNLERLVAESVAKLAGVMAEKERINAELDIARQIQMSLLPAQSFARTGCGGFDLYATMTPAKEVGGDFYDYFLIDRDHLGIVAGDVSGKGIPAALFMIVTKTLIKNFAMMGLGPAEVFIRTNEQLCLNNDAGMFVTAFFGILDLRSGGFTFVNAGHNFPLLRRADHPYDWLKSPIRLVLAYMSGTRYEDSVLSLGPGDMLYLYTDGVTESANAQSGLFGNDRLLELLDANPALGPNELLQLVMREVSAFSGGEPQSDDITMLGLEYAGDVPAVKNI